MFCAHNKMCAFILVTATLLASILGQAQLLGDDEEASKPWPTYSLQNMPKTKFTCHDKILGGYYADPDTQCQMFHVCVKLPGIGIQDYRFLCPNSTTFDQELQICANWADVDCDKALLYFDNNHFNDLYRANAAEEGKGGGVEEESTFHLQHAESGDVRHAKENRSDQKSRGTNYGRHNYVHPNSNADNYSTQTSRKPISSYYTPTTTSTTSTTTTERSYNNNNNNDDSKQDFDDIFKGSHSSHFFANRHGGREYDDDHPAPTRARLNDFTDSNRKTTETSKARVSPTRGQRLTSSSTTLTSTTTAPVTKSLKKITLHASFNADFLDNLHHYKSTTSTPSTTTKTSTAATATSPRLGSSITSRFSFGVGDAQAQEQIQPTTYNPHNGAYRFKTTTTPKYTALPRESTKLTGKSTPDFDKDTKRNKPTVAARKIKLGPQESNYINQNEFAELPKAKLQQPQPFQAAQGVAKKSSQFEPQYQRSRAQQLGRVGTQEPAPFSSPKQRSGAAASVAPSSKPRTFTSRGSITYKATTERYADDEFFYPTTTDANVKKISVHTYKDAFIPTTFKPTTYKKPYEVSYYQTQQALRPTHSSSTTTKKSPSGGSTSSITNSLPTTANPNYNADEDDGQYRPELYENDFPRNRFKFLRGRSTTSTSTSTSTTTATPASSRQSHAYNHNFQQAHSHLKSQQQSAYQKEHDQADLSDEDELFKTAQSLNFGAASINKLRADIYKAEKTSQQYNSQYSPNSAAAQSSPKTFTSSSSSTTTITTSRPYSTYAPSSTTVTTTTRRPTTTISTTTSSTVVPKPSKPSKTKKEQHEKKPKSASKRTSYAEEDTSYDYAYYDTD